MKTVWNCYSLRAFVSSADNLFKLSDPDQDLQNFDLIWIQTVWHSDVVFVKEFFERVDFGKI